MAYRSRKDTSRAETANAGLVVDMVRQFADKYAFVRELVQNGIDAGATQIEMRAQYREGEGVFSVRDDGEGMTREIIEGPLLTLFNSAKDEDDTKIGKYGVGFVSVFAIDPDEVLVQTWRLDVSWSLSIRPDHSYELSSGAEGRPRPHDNGTVVSLRKRMTRKAFVEHVGEVAAALRRWCRHAHLPIVWRVEQEGAEPTHARVDRSLAVRTAVTVDAQLDGMHIVLGPGAGAEAPAEAARKSPSFAGFYNHGLTLFETTQPLESLAGIRFKIDSPALSHTLSRDNVRQDDAYHFALRRVRELVSGSLRRTVVERLRSAAMDASDSAQYARLLLAAAGTASLRVKVGDIVVPLCHAIDGKTFIAADDLAVRDLAVYERAPTKISAALAKRGHPVLRADWPTPVLEALATKIDCAIQPAHAAFALLTPRSKKRASRRDAMFEGAVAEMLVVAGQAADRVSLVDVLGAPVDEAGVRVSSSKVAQLLLADERDRRFRFRKPREWMLPADHEMVAAARVLANRDLRSAAHLLTRYLIVESCGEVAKGSSDALLAAVAGVNR